MSVLSHEQKDLFLSYQLNKTPLTSSSGFGLNRSERLANWCAAGHAGLCQRERGAHDGNARTHSTYFELWTLQTDLVLFPARRRSVLFVNNENHLRADCWIGDESSILASRLLINISCGFKVHLQTHQSRRSGQRTVYKNKHIYPVSKNRLENGSQDSTC